MVITSFRRCHEERIMVALFPTFKGSDVTRNEKVGGVGKVAIDRNLSRTVVIIDVILSFNLTAISINYISFSTQSNEAYFEHLPSSRPHSFLIGPYL
jgi:hypothetical protein